MAKNLKSFEFTNKADKAISKTGWEVGPGVVVNALAGDDTITGSGNTDSAILNYGSIYTGDGDDKIVAIGGDDAIYNTGTIDTGNGNDTIDSTDIENDTKILTGHGHDIITGKGELDNDFGAIVNTGSGNDKITFYNIWNDGLIDTGSGNDIVDALKGGFRGDTEGPPSGEIKLGIGNDTLKGFGTGGFYGGAGKDKILFGKGIYKISKSTIVSSGMTMRVNEFEQIGGANGGLFTFKNGTLNVNAAGVGTFV